MRTSGAASSDCRLDTTKGATERASRGGGGEEVEWDLCCNNIVSHHSISGPDDQT